MYYSLYPWWGYVLVRGHLACTWTRPKGEWLRNPWNDTDIWVGIIHTRRYTYKNSIAKLQSPCLWIHYTFTHKTEPLTHLYKYDTATNNINLVLWSKEWLQTVVFHMTHFVSAAYVSSEAFSPLEHLVWLWYQFYPSHSQLAVVYTANPTTGHTHGLVLHPPRLPEGCPRNQHAGPGCAWRA